MHGRIMIYDIKRTLITFQKIKSLRTSYNLNLNFLRSITTCLQPFHTVPRIPQRRRLLYAKATRITFNWSNAWLDVEVTGRCKRRWDKRNPGAACTAHAPVAHPASRT